MLVSVRSPFPDCHTELGFQEAISPMANIEGGKKFNRLRVKIGGQATLYLWGKKRGHSKIYLSRKGTTLCYMIHFQPINQAHLNKYDY